MHRRLTLTLFVMQMLFVAAAFGQTPVRFVTVNQGHDEFQSDTQLHHKLGPLVKDERPTPQSYEAAVDKAIRAGEEAHITRMTPYVFVASEMQGAKLDIIGTYRSLNTGKTTYHSYFVVRRDAFPDVTEGDSPTLTEVVAWLRTKSLEGNPLQFLFHSRWSTSSYFLPSLFFRSQRIFAVSGRQIGSSERSDSDEPITSILVNDADTGSSSALVRMVARKPGSFSAVWEGTRSKFQHEPEGNEVFFVQIPGDLPNDLLVASRSVDPATKLAIEKKLENGIDLEDGDSDVDIWQYWKSADTRDARAALSVLRRRALTPPAPIVVEVKNADDSPPVEKNVLEAVRQAVRLSGTELVVKDDYYVMSDVEWGLSPIHDGALRLNAVYKNFDLDHHSVKQEFRLSYLDPDDLTRRVGGLIHNRMHRIRPLWLYQNTEPTIIRSFDFAVSIAEPIPYQVIDWEDPESNSYTLVSFDLTEATEVDFNKLRLDKSKGDFPVKNDKSLDFEPMGRTEYRALLIRPTTERPLFRALTVILIVLFFLAAIGAIWDMKRAATRKQPLKEG